MLFKLIVFLFFAQDYIVEFVDDKCQFDATSLSAQNMHFWICVSALQKFLIKMQTLQLHNYIINIKTSRG